MEVNHLFEVDTIWLDKLDLPTLEKPLHRLNGKFIGRAMLQQVKEHTHKASGNVW